MKYIFLFFLVMNIVGMGDENEPVKKIKPQKPSYNFLLNKINHLENRIAYIVYYADGDMEMLQDVQRLQDKLIKLQAKLQEFHTDERN